MTLVGPAGWGFRAGQSEPLEPFQFGDDLNEGVGQLLGIVEEAAGGGLEKVNLGKGTGGRRTHALSGGTLLVCSVSNPCVSWRT